MNDRVQRAIADLLNKWRTDPDHYPRHQHDCSNMSEEEVAAVTSWFKVNQETQLSDVGIVEDEATKRRHIFLWPKRTSQAMS